MRLGRLKEAISHFSESLRIKPDFADVHNNMGAALMRLGRLKEAIKHYSEALRIKPDSPATRDNLRQIMRAAEKTEMEPNKSARQ
jgi:Flp pilus assembly protein TadD